MRAKLTRFTAQSVADQHGLSASTARYRLGKLHKLGLVCIFKIDPEYGQKVYEADFPFAFLWDNQDKLVGPKEKKVALRPPEVNWHNIFNQKNAVDMRWKEV